MVNTWYDVTLCTCVVTLHTLPELSTNGPVTSPRWWHWLMTSLQPWTPLVPGWHRLMSPADITAPGLGRKGVCLLLVMDNGMLLEEISWKFEHSQDYTIMISEDICHVSSGQAMMSVMWGRRLQRLLILVYTRGNGTYHSRMVINNWPRTARLG